MAFKHTYEDMLKRAYKALPEVSKTTTRFEIPSVKGSIQGKKTIVTNLTQIANKLGRELRHLVKFLSKELATTSNIEQNSVNFVGKFGSKSLNEKLDKYVKEFVLCSQCGKPDTKIIKDRNITFKRCEACGAKSTVRSIK